MGPLTHLYEMFRSRWKSFLADPWLESTSDESFKSIALATNRQIGLSLFLMTYVCMLLAVINPGLPLLVKAEVMGAILVTTPMAIVFSTCVSFAIVKLLQSPLQFRGYLGVLFKELPLTLSVGVFGGCCLIVNPSVASGFLIVLKLLFSTIVQYRILVLSQIRRYPAFIAVIVLTFVSLFFEVGHTFQIGTLYAQ